MPPRRRHSSGPLGRTQRRLTHARGSRMSLHKQKRAVIAVGVLIVAAILHVGLCEWHFGGALGRTDRFDPICVQWSQNNPYGLSARRGVSRESALRDGVALPISLVVLVAALCLHWRERDRIADRRCLNCGHLLGPSDVC